MMHVARVVLAVVLAVAGFVVLPGCLIAGERDVSLSGEHIDEQSLTLLETGVTTEDDVLALLGVPSRVVEFDGDRTVYVYEWSKREKSSTAVFLIFGGSSTTETEGAANIEFRNGAVHRWWTS
jgi:outer membrane protein assembly factor BamE (lipoprotein component of BamABCDE complex)